MLADPLFDRLARALAGRYTLVRELGWGGMATVYLGTEVKLGRGVAIKVVAPATRAYLGSDRFQEEVLLAAQLSHPHVVPRFEADDVDRRRHRGEHGGLHEPGAGERRQADRPAQRRILPAGGAVRNAGRRAAVYRTERASDRGSRAQRPAAADPHGAPRASGAPR